MVKLSLKHCVRLRCHQVVALLVTSVSLSALFAYTTMFPSGGWSGDGGGGGQAELQSADKYYSPGSTLGERLAHFPHTYSPYPYLIESEPCDDNVTLLIGVCSAVRHVERRAAIRRTWATWATNDTLTGNVRVLFVFGRSGGDWDESLRNESDAFGDVVQEDFLDTYYNLTLKSLLLLRWSLERCGAAKYVMKTDDDMFVNVPNLSGYVRALHELRGGADTSPPPPHMFGHVIHGAVPDRERNRKYYQGTFPITRVYPDYLSGTGYVMSRRAVSLLYGVARREPLFFVEDVFITGICASRAHIRREQHRGFHYEKRAADACTFRSLVTAHHMSAGEMTDMWRRLQRTNLTAACSYLTDTLPGGLWGTSMALLGLMFTLILLSMLIILAQKC